MKNNFLVKIFLFISVIPLFVFASRLNGLNDLANAFKQSDAKKIVSYFDTMVEIKILEKEGTFSKSQSEQIIKDFFAHNKITDFKFKHDGTASGKNAQYAIGTLTTVNEKFRTYIYMKKKGDTFVIQEFKIENE